MTTPRKKGLSRNTPIFGCISALVHFPISAMIKYVFNANTSRVSTKLDTKLNTYKYEGIGLLSIKYM